MSGGRAGPAVGGRFRQPAGRWGSGSRQPVAPAPAADGGGRSGSRRRGSGSRRWRSLRQPAGRWRTGRQALRDGSRTRPVGPARPVSSRPIPPYPASSRPELLRTTPVFISPRFSLLTSAGSRSLHDWLRDRFFAQHCKLFHHRPFVWHIWDGRRDGFHALVNYHKLAAGGGDGRRLLESLTYSYLGDWITRQKDGIEHGVPGAEDRLAAALRLQQRLDAITVGERPFDIFIRWKPLAEQPIGWEPDVNDGVRLNVRPFMAADLPGGRAGAGILRAKPNVHWRKDRGKEPRTLPAGRKPSHWQQDQPDPHDDRDLRPQHHYPWFWANGQFTGDRLNDLHLTNAVKSGQRPPASSSLDGVVNHSLVGIGSADG